MSTAPDPMQLAAAKRLVHDSVNARRGIGLADPGRLAADCRWVVSHPVNTLLGPGQVAERYLEPLARALPDAERRVDLFFGGHWDGRVDGGAGCWVTCTGHSAGTLQHELFGIPAHGGPVRLRFGEFYRVEGDRIAEARILLDLVDLARQAGRPVLPTAAGVEGWVPGPRDHDGLLLTAHDPAEGAASLALVEAMIGGLGRYDRQALHSMGMQAYWHPDMMWYGPGGIGTTRSIEGFQTHHQQPFLAALPDRKGGHHRARFAEGAYVASTGWPSVRATHLGPYLGEPASGRAVTMRVMDWWRVEDGLLAENWVLIDLPEFFLQTGVDILARAAA